MTIYKKIMKLTELRTLIREEIKSMSENKSTRKAKELIQLYGYSTDYKRDLKKRYPHVNNIIKRIIQDFGFNGEDPIKQAEKESSAILKSEEKFAKSLANIKTSSDIPKVIDIAKKDSNIQKLYNFFKFDEDLNRANFNYADSYWEEEDIDFLDYIAHVVDKYGIKNKFIHRR